MPIPKRLMHILEGESLLNDASGLVCFQFAVAAAVTGSFSLADASLTFLWVAFAGVAAGIGVTVAVSLAQRWIWRQVGEHRVDLCHRDARRADRLRPGAGSARP